MQSIANDVNPTAHTTPHKPTAFAPGSWLGMVGGGQLGRMFCHAAQRLGYRVLVLDPAEGCPAGVVADEHLRAAYDDADALAHVAQHCVAVTTEFENVPAQTLEHLAVRLRVSPSAAALSVAQDRIREKTAVRDMGIAVVDYAPVHGPDDIAHAPDALFPGILKAARLGYDGKGQVRVATRAHALQAWETLQAGACVLEALAPLAREISVVVARGFDDALAVYEPMTNEHRNGILAVSTAAPLPAALSDQARQTAATLAQALDYRGVLCVEFFVLTDGRLLVNEIAPRPHNSGHHTIEACASSQFDQQVRVLAGLPLGDAALLRPAVMRNLLGDLWFDAQGRPREPDWSAVLAIPQAHLHLYGKAHARKGRKMGHVTVTGDTLQDASARAARVAAALGLDDQQACAVREPMLRGSPAARAH